MQDIINKFNDFLSQKDLFHFWQDELHLRKQVRYSDPMWEGVLIQSPEDFHFIKRALYFGGKKDVFFDLLYLNISNASIIDWMLKDSPALVSGFLHFLMPKIVDSKPGTRNMQFLINMYREEFHPDFQQLIAVMDSSLCSHLLSRTTNNNLRELFKARQEQIAAENQREHYGLISSQQFIADYPTIYGDKISIMVNAVKSLKLSQTLSLESSPRHESFAALLNGTEMLFRAGMLTDCLALLAEMLEGPEVLGLVKTDEEAHNQRINQLIRKALPIYSLLVNPGDPHRYALELYRSLFPGFNPDPPSLLYLELYPIVLSGLQGYRRYARYELAQKATRILSYRPDDSLASLLQNPGDILTMEELSLLQDVVAQRIPTQPHESLVIMEILRLWQREGRAALNRESATHLLRDYLHFFNWIPTTTFINEQLLEQLGPMADEASRSLVQQIIDNSQGSTMGWTINELPESKLSDQENRHLQKKLLLGKYMGVL